MRRTCQYSERSEQLARSLRDSYSATKAAGKLAFHPIHIQQLVYVMFYCLKPMGQSSFRLFYTSGSIGWALLCNPFLRQDLTNRMVIPVHSGSPLLGVETISCHEALERLFFASSVIRNKKIQAFLFPMYKAKLMVFSSSSGCVYQGSSECSPHKHSI